MADAVPLTDKDLALRDANGEAKKYRLKLRESQKKADTLQAERDGLARALKDKDAAHLTEVDAYRADLDKATKAASASPDEWKQKYEGLSQTVREGKHKAAIRKALAEMKAQDDDTAVSDLWAATQYKAESDDPDDKAIRALLEPALKARPWLAKPEPAAPDPAAAAAKNGPGAQRAPIQVQGREAGPGMIRGATETDKPLTTVAEKVDREFAATGRTDARRI